MKAILEAKNIVKYFGSDESKTYAIKGVNLKAYYGAYNILCVNFHFPFLKVF